MMAPPDATVRVGRLAIEGWAVPTAAGRFEPLRSFEPGALWMQFMTVREPIRGDLLDWNGSIIDVIGWEAKEPAAWWTLNREAEAIGYEELTRSWWMATQARLFDSPADWLVHHGNGFCVIDWMQDVDRMIGRATGFICQSEVMAERLRQCVRNIHVTVATATDAWRRSSGQD
jgi:hypothetical protein